MKKKDTGLFFAVFAQLQKRCHETPKMAQRDTGP